MIEIGTCLLCNNVRVLVKSADIPICLKCNKTYHNKTKTRTVKIIDLIKLRRDYESGLTIKDLALKNKCGNDLITSRLKGCGCVIRSVGGKDWCKHKSANHQGIELKDWKEFITEKPYCNKFNEICREQNREKYGRKCFICGKDEVKNGKRLSVHHIDKNKNQGCDSIDWSLVPLCSKHHGSCHNDLWESRINYLLNHVWNR